MTEDPPVTALPVEGHLRFLHGAARSLLATERPADLLSSLFAQLSDLIGIEFYLSHTLVEAGGRRFFELDSSAGLEVRDRERFRRLEADEPLCAVLGLGEEPVVLDDLALSPDPRAGALRELGIGAWACMPLRVGERRLGTLAFGTRARSRLTAPEVELVRSVAVLAALAVERSRIQRERDTAGAALEARGRRLHTVPESVDTGGDRDFYFSLFDELPAMVWRSDPTGSADYFSTARLAFTGRPPEEELGYGWVRGLHPEDAERVMETYHAAFRAREPFEVEYRLRNAAGEYRPILDIGRPFHDPRGTFQGYLGVAFDLGERRVLETRLRQAQKMEAVGRLAGGVAHDFNNLLTVISGHVTLALQGLDAADPVLADLTEIEKAARRASTLTRQLLAFSRQQILAPRVLDPGRVIVDVESMLRRLIGEDVVLEVRVERPLASVKADRGQFEQILLNLAVNARDAMPSGGRLGIEARNVSVTADDARRRPWVGSGEFVSIAVTDTGHGMDETTLARIFEPFFTTKGPDRGTGLGLATVYGIVKQSDGFVWVDSEPGRGTRFEILLPRAVGPAEEAPPPRKGSVRSGTETILVVEDEAALRSLTRRVLAREGYTVLEAADGREALEVLDRHPGSVDLLLTDVVMPGMGGFELGRALARALPTLPVLYMTGYTEERVTREEVRERSAVFLEKPFTPSGLIEAVRERLDEGRVPDGGGGEEVP